MNFLRLIVVLGLGSAALLLNGCATLSEAECVSGNWEQLGFSEGSAGYPADYVLQHEKACADYSVRVDRELYERGRQAGLKTFCVSASGYSHGYAINDAHGQCRASFPDYMTGYLNGLQDKQARLAAEHAEITRDFHYHSSLLLRTYDPEEKLRIEDEMRAIENNLADIDSEYERVRYLLDQHR